MRKIFIASLLFLVATSAQASVYEMRDYFESLGSPYPVQSGSNLWTFQYGNHNGGMLVPSGANYVSSPYAYQQIGFLINSGDAAQGGSGGPPSYPTFDGVFVHLAQAPLRRRCSTPLWRWRSARSICGVRLLVMAPQVTAST